MNPFNLFASRSLFGFDVVAAPLHAKYVLPAEVIPGVPWPPGFREEINRWSVDFLGTTCLVPRGMAYVMGHTVVMRPEDVVRISNLTA